MYLKIFKIKRIQSLVLSDKQLPWSFDPKFVNFNRQLISVYCWDDVLSVPKTSRAYNVYRGNRYDSHNLYSKHRPLGR